MSVYNVGFLPLDVSYDFAGVTIRPLANFAKASDWISRYRHEDGFIYPPTGHMVDHRKRRKPNTERPQHLHRLPPSHAISLNVQDDSTRRHGVFLMHTLGYLHRVWLQMEDWWFDARVPVGKRSDISIKSQTAQRFLSQAYAKWQSWPSEDQARFNNILFMLNRAVSYEWDWEHFVIEYILADACYRIAISLQLMAPERSHSGRISAMCRHFGLAQNDDLVQTIVNLRNDLFHESLWDSGMPGSGKSHESFMAPFHLRRLNQRLIPAILGYQNSYVAEAWWSIGTSNFD